MATGFVWLWFTFISIPHLLHTFIWHLVKFYGCNRYSLIIMYFLCVNVFEQVPSESNKPPPCMGSCSPHLFSVIAKQTIHYSFTEYKGRGRHTVPVCTGVLLILMVDNTLSDKVKPKQSWVNQPIALFGTFWIAKRLQMLSDKGKETQFRFHFSVPLLVSVASTQIWSVLYKFFLFLILPTTLSNHE